MLGRSVGSGSLHERRFFARGERTWYAKRKRADDEKVNCGVLFERLKFYTWIYSSIVNLTMFIEILSNLLFLPAQKP